MLCFSLFIRSTNKTIILFYTVTKLSVAVTIVDDFECVNHIKVFHSVAENVLVKREGVQVDDKSFIDFH